MTESRPTLGALRRATESANQDAPEAQDGEVSTYRDAVDDKGVTRVAMIPDWVLSDPVVTGHRTTLHTYAALWIAANYQTGGWEAVADSTGLGRSTVYRDMQLLVDGGVIVKLPSGRYFLPLDQRVLRGKIDYWKVGTAALHRYGRVFSPTDHVVYRHFTEEGILLYVGYSGAVSRRQNEHQKTAPWWDLSVRMDVEWFDGRDEALNAELQAIRNEHPLWNVQGNAR